MKVILFLLDHLSKEEAEAEWDREKLRYLKYREKKERESDLFCLSNFPDGWDPEMGASSYPITTSLVMGLQVNF